MKELKDIIDQLEVVSYDDYTKELSVLENTFVVVGNVEKLSGSEDYIVVSPLNNHKQKFQFKIKDIEKIEKFEDKVFKIFIKDDSSCIVMYSYRIKNKSRFDFRKMGFPSSKTGGTIMCDRCDSCICDCDSCQCYDCDCDSCYECYSDCDYVA